MGKERTVCSLGVVVLRGHVCPWCELVLEGADLGRHELCRDSCALDLTWWCCRWHRVVCVFIGDRETVVESRSQGSPTLGKDRQRKCTNVVAFRRVSRCQMKVEGEFQQR
ncbi:hypothetical protein Micbo1qcDRAFT_14912 [Microdochium bolleyi]|uniref:Uncharacterized protein n=1 Tax=Microdochium bolleyi TaxID=196109 RepID=A0A136IWC0_9PEZI|nr:hypothetical protein Micbo1qcDRAFT_14912 [Microdochium bolleyi]